MSNENKGLLCFFLTVIFSSAAVDVLLARGGPDILYLVLMWMPALSALQASVVTLRSGGNPVTFSAICSLCSVRKCSWRYIVQAAVIPLVYLLIPYLIYWQIEPGSFQTNATNPAGMVLSILIAIIVGNILSLLSALGEELGWRGYLVPALSRSFGGSVALWGTSLFWCLWHFPLILFDGYMGGTPLWYTLLSFVLAILPVGLIAGVLSLRSGSVWPAAVLHAAHNNYDQAIFGLMTTGDNKMYFVSETGIFTIVCAWAIAIPMMLSFSKQSSGRSSAEDSAGSSPNEH